MMGRSSGGDSNVRGEGRTGAMQEGTPSLPLNLTTDYKLGANGDLLVTMTAFRNNQTVHTEIVKNYFECDGSEQVLAVGAERGRPI